MLGVWPGPSIFLSWCTIFAVSSRYLRVCSILFVNVEPDHRRRLHCDSSTAINPNAKKGGNEEVDIFHDSDTASYNAARAAAQFILNDSIQAVHAVQSDRLKGNIASLDPNSSDCMWLRINHIERAGLGHTFDAWSYYLRLSIDNRLTYYSPFFSAAHEVCNLNETTALFGLHSAYYWARSPPQKAEVVEVEKSTGQCDAEALSKAVDRYRRENHPSCSKGHVVFKCYNGGLSLQKRLAGSIQGVETAVRAVFRAAYKRYKNSYIIPQVRDALASKEIIVTVHMRRGDVMRGKVDQNHRLVSYGVYVRMIKEMMNVRAAESANISHPIRLFFLCEGSANNHSIVEYDPVDLHKSNNIDIHKDLGSVCNRENACIMEVLHTADFLQSFTTMCESDVLVTSTSGFPFVVAALCEPKMTLGIKFSASYDGIKNVVNVQHDQPLWRWNSQFRLDGLKDKWGNVISRIGEPNFS